MALTCEVTAKSCWGVLLVAAIGCTGTAEDAASASGGVSAGGGPGGAVAGGVAVTGGSGGAPAGGSAGESTGGGVSTGGSATGGVAVTGGSGGALTGGSGGESTGGAVGTGGAPSDCTAPAGFVVVSSLSELLPYLDDDNVQIAMAPGTYRVTPDDADSGLFPDPALLVFSGSDSVYDFNCVTIEVETEVMRSYGAVDFTELQITGNDNVVRGLTLTDIGDAAPGGRATSVTMDGIGNRIEGLHLTVRGSFPYGYGDAFGKGGSPVIGHHKHSAILVRGNANHLLNATVIHRAYGHGIFMQAASDPVIEGCYVEGEVRTTDDMLAEEGTGSPADNVDFMTEWGYRLPPGHMMSLQEEGIRAYNAGETTINGEEISRGTNNVTVLDCTIKYMRGGVTLTHATGIKYVEGTTAIGCERGFAIGSGDIVGCEGDALYGPVLGFDYSSDSNANIDITVLSSAGAYNGSNAIAYIGGSGHNITLRSSETNVDQSLRFMVSGDNTSVRHGAVGSSQDDLTSSDIEINNLTDYPLVLAPKSSGCSGQSNGLVTDDGSGNDITQN